MKKTVGTFMGLPIVTDDEMPVTDAGFYIGSITEVIKTMAAEVDRVAEAAKDTAKPTTE